MVLETLELFERAQVRVAVGKIGDQTNINLTVFQVIQERAAGGARFVQRPAGGVNNQTWLVFGRVDVPQLFDTDAVVLRILAFVQLEVVDQALAQMTTTAFGEQGVLGAQLHSRHVAVFLGTVTGNAHVTGDNAFYLAIFDDGF